MILSFDKIVNARELGKIKAGNNLIKSNLLIRSANLSMASCEDIRRLKEDFKLKLICDFRTDHEVNLAPDREIPGCVNKQFNVIGAIPQTNTKDGDGLHKLNLASMNEETVTYMVKFVKQGILNNTMRNVYTLISMKQSANEEYAKMFDAILETRGGAVLWHCSQGKDRAGFATALVLSALGVSRDEILKDFEISNDGYKSTLEMARAIGESEKLSEEEQGVLKALIGVNSDYMEENLDLIEMKFGSMEQYLHTAIRLTDDKIRLLRDYYLDK